MKYVRFISNYIGRDFIKSGIWLIFTIPLGLPEALHSSDNDGCNTELLALNIQSKLESLRKKLEERVRKSDEALAAHRKLLSNQEHLLKHDNRFFASWGWRSTEGNPERIRLEREINREKEKRKSTKKELESNSGIRRELENFLEELRAFEKFSSQLSGRLERALHGWLLNSARVKVKASTVPEEGTFNKMGQRLSSFRDYFGKEGELPYPLLGEYFSEKSKDIEQEFGKKFGSKLAFGSPAMAVLTWTVIAHGRSVEEVGEFAITVSKAVPKFSKKNIARLTYLALRFGSPIEATLEIVDRIRKEFPEDKLILMLMEVCLRTGKHPQEVTELYSGILSKGNEEHIVFGKAAAAVFTAGILVYEISEEELFGSFGVFEESPLHSDWGPYENSIAAVYLCRNPKSNKISAENLSEFKSISGLANRMALIEMLSEFDLEREKILYCVKKLAASDDSFEVAKAVAILNHKLDSPISHSIDFNRPMYEWLQTLADSERLKIESDKTIRIIRLLRDPKTSRVALDALAYEYVMTRSKKRTVSLVLGDPWRIPSQSEREQVGRLTATLVENGVRILYDGDSKLGSVIAEKGGQSALGISGQETKQGKDGVLVISNPYLKLRALSLKANGQVIISPKSTTGMGLFIGGGANVVWDMADKWEDTYNLGSKFLARCWKADWFFQSKNRLKNQDQVAEFILERTGRHEPHSKNFPSFSAHEFLVAQSSDTLEEIVGLVDSFESGIQFLSSQSASGNTIAFFASKKEMNQFDALISGVATEVSRKGVGVATGGGAGLMDIYTKAAHKLGVPSIAVRMDKGGDPHSENFSLVVKTREYRTRIPLLLHQRAFHLVGPGYSGTLRELATIFSVYGSGQTLRPTVLVGSDFYESLFRVLSESPISPKVKKHLHLINEPKAIVPIVERWAVGKHES